MADSGPLSNRYLDRIDRRMLQRSKAYNKDMKRNVRDPGDAIFSLIFLEI